MPSESCSFCLSPQYRLHRLARWLLVLFATRAQAVIPCACPAEAEPAAAKWVESCGDRVLRLSRSLRANAWCVLWRILTQQLLCEAASQVRGTGGSGISDSALSRTRFIEVLGPRADRT